MATHFDFQSLRIALVFACVLAAVPVTLLAQSTNSPPSSFIERKEVGNDGHSNKQGNVQSNNQGTDQRSTQNIAQSIAQNTDQNSDARLLKLNADLDDDGIIDAVKSLASLNSTDFDSNALADASKKGFSADFQAAQHARSRSSRRNACFDYMMLSPEDKDRVNQRVQSRTLGMFGTRPCDPFVSPLLERPFDDEYVEIPLKPIGSVVVR
jgi:hypothetical protein